MSLKHLLLALPMVFLASPAFAQAPEQSVSINPLGAMFGVYSVEYERVMTPQVTAAASASHWSAGGSFGGAEAGVSYTSLDLKGKYYPGEAMRGFYFGGLAGFSMFKGGATTTYNYDDPWAEPQSTSESAKALTFGVELGYNALLGADDQIVFGTGLGAKKLMAMGGNSTAEMMGGYPFIRLSIGYAF